jgi:hypothetical protein
VSRELLAAALLGQQHEAPAAAHFVLLAAVVATALTLLGRALGTPLRPDSTRRSGVQSAMDLHPQGD